MESYSEGGTWQVFDNDGRRKYLTSNERTRYLGACRRLPAEMRALCEVLAFAGCRISEALALTPQHIDTESLTLTFRTLKRRRIIFRVVPVPEAIIEALAKLGAGPDGRLFRLHRATAWRLVKSVMVRAGIVGPMACPRGLRHTFGMRAANANVPPTILQKWMGHSSLKTTGIYIAAMCDEERRFASRMW